MLRYVSSVPMLMRFFLSQMHLEFCQGKEGNPRNHYRLNPADRFDAVCADLPGKNEQW